ncbi:sulfotransferase family protein [Halopolyspora algeriensis]|uniref:Sulfotransferase family protein n=1 Tax=Halopolyspora algeriensis TaxID=1500506 RepID=A0A368VU30_9ACTN|nr:sulfotransferase [Halopolyspora algeriensis]RCW44583.1 sulfotransferase family protein [Halopolyspora algeriensis]TQM55943.1 sulfotransferase family protein [Halopolyspora algeriensis]
MSTGRASVGTVEDLHDSAARVTGLDDFGDDDHREGLGVLLDSYARQAGLTPRGNKVTRAQLRGALMARQFSEAAWQRYPEYTDVAIERPIFVTGLPRTGTTALHRLLCADPQHQGPDLWLTEVPQPRPPRETWEDNPVFRRLQEGYRHHHVENPEFMGVHYMSADTVEECWQLLRQSMMSVSFESLAHVPDYSEWLAARDWTQAYRRHRRNLQLIGLNDAGCRWVLKNPSHLFALDAIMAVYPDALIIQTHRDPRTVIASSSSLSRHATEGHSHVFRDEVIGRDQLDLWARGIERFMADRARYDPARFVDVQYEDFTADPLGTAEAVYDHFGLPFTERARAAMAKVHADGKASDRRPAHRYALSDFGLTAEEVDERFARYRQAYLR